VWERRQISSAKSRSSSFGISQSLPLHSPSAVFFITSSIITRNIIGDSLHPCLTPDITGMGDVMLYNLYNNKLINVHGAAGRTMFLSHISLLEISSVP
jgi:hypothetical protein